MASLKALKIRIGSVKSTQKITKALNMVAASKLRRAQQNATAALGILLRSAQLRRGDHFHRLGDLLRRLDRADADLEGLE